MASRFWTGGSDSEGEEDEVSTEESESSSSESGDSSSSTSASGSESSTDGSESGSDDDEEMGARAGRFIAGGSSDSDSDEDRKVVLKSAKDKRFSELADTCDEIRNKMKINDWSSIQTLFDELNKRLERTVKVATNLTGTPRPYIRILIELEDFIVQTFADKELKKKMSSSNAKAFNTMRQRLKKHNLPYADELLDYREHPPAEDGEDEDDEEESEMSDEDEDEHESGEEGAEDQEGFERKGQKKKDKLLTMDPKEITFEMVARKLQEIIMSRGRRGTDRQEQVEMLTYLSNVARGPAQRYEVLAQLVSSLFDLNPGASNFLKVSLWKRSVNILFEMMGILQENPNLIVTEAYAGLGDEPLEEPEAGAETNVWGNLVAFVERLDDELFKSLQIIDAHTHQYMSRLRDEPVLLALSQKVVEYFARVGDTRSLPKIQLRLVEHFYYKTENVYSAMRKMTIAQQEEQRTRQGSQTETPVQDGEPRPEDTPEDGIDEKVECMVPLDYVMEENCHVIMQQLVTAIFKQGDERTKARAMLCHIYHKCIHGQFYVGRDMLLMSHLQDNIQHMDISTQILYNRAMAQLGLAAFRLGLIPEAHSCLVELYGSGHIRELLAQGISLGKYQQEKTPDQELLEKRRQMPFHMHITMELLESVCLISAMLLEVPNIASASAGAPKKKVISKNFYRILDAYSRQTFTGPPENVRDHIMAASKSLLKGDWSKAYTYVSALTVWNLMPEKESVLEMLKGKLQEEALKTYCLTYSKQYSSLSLDLLCDMFELPEKKVYGVVSSMMMSEDLAGSWDQPTRTIILHNVETSPMLQLATQFADKANLLVDLNQRALSFRTGGLRDADDDGPEGGGGGESRRGRGGRRGGHHRGDGDRDDHRRHGGHDDDGGRGNSRRGARLGMVRSAGAGAGHLPDRVGDRGGERRSAGGRGGRLRDRDLAVYNQTSLSGRGGAYSGARTFRQVSSNMSTLGNIAPRAGGNLRDRDRGEQGPA